MSRADTFDAIVVGAGVVGSTAALALAGEGLRVAVVEASEPARWDPGTPDLRVYALANDARELLQSIGVWDSIAGARVQAYRRMQVWDAGGAGELCIDADQLGRPSLGHIVEHGLLVDRLWTAVSRHPSIVRHCPARLDSISDDGETVSAGLADGRRLRARLLVGADGAGSRVREVVGLSTRDNDYAQRALVAYVKTEVSHGETCWQRFLPGGPLAFLPCADGSSSIVWSLPEQESLRLQVLDDASFCAELTRAFDARLGKVLATSGRAGFPLRRRLASSMLRGRTALIGDAAHVVHPLAGQGLNLGLRDVMALRDDIHAASARGRDWSADHRLQRWARTRMSESAVSAHAFEAINRVFSNDAVLPTLFRGRMLGMAGAFPPATQWLWRRAAGI